MPTDEEIQEEILRILVQEFQEDPGMITVGAQSLIDEAGDGMQSADEDQLIYNLNRLDDTHAIEHSGAGASGMVELEESGIDLFEELSNETIIPRSTIRIILEKLEEAERANPQTPAVTREELLESDDLSEDDLDMTVWYLNEGHYIDAMTQIGTPFYHQAEITKFGREMLDQL